MNTKLRHTATALLTCCLLLAAVPSFGAQAAVNVNTADASQLELLPRVGPSISARILEFRKENGPFKALEDLMLVRGIGEKTFEQMKPFVKLSGETDLRQKVRAGDLAKKSEAEG
jgi:competence protein ComEA